MLAESLLDVGPERRERVQRLGLVGRARHIAVALLDDHLLGGMLLLALGFVPDDELAPLLLLASGAAAVSH